jgi:hypothetical protein
MSKRHVKEACQRGMSDKTDCTIVKFEAKSKELMNEAKAKANIISRKRADILSVFEASMKVVTENSKKIQTFDTRLEDLATELATKMNDESLDNDQICVQITKINTAQKAFQSQKELTLKTIIEHFGEAMTLGRSKTTDLVALTIPDRLLSASMDLTSKYIAPICSCTPNVCRVSRPHVSLCFTCTSLCGTAVFQPSAGTKSTRN